MHPGFHNGSSPCGVSVFAPFHALTGGLNVYFSSRIFFSFGSISTYGPIDGNYPNRHGMVLSSALIFPSRVKLHLIAGNNLL